MGQDKFSTLKSPKRRCTRCEYEWFLRAEIERGRGRTGANRGSIINVGLAEPLNCPNSKCKSPYWNRERGVKA